MAVTAVSCFGHTLPDRLLVNFLNEIMIDVRLTYDDGVPSSVSRVSIVDLGAVVPVEAPHLGVHDALVCGGKHLGRGHVFVAPCAAGPENVIT